MAARLKITQVGSRIHAMDAQRKVLDGLGLRRPRHTVVREDTPAIRGMLAKVGHLVRWEPVEEA